MDIRHLSHILQICAFPPGLILVLLLIGFIFIQSRQHRMGRLLIIAAFMILWIFSTPFFTQTFIDQLQNKYPPLSELDHNLANDSNHSALIVLGSGVEKGLEYASKHKLSDKSLSRLQYAVYLHYQLHLPIIVSGGNRVRTTIKITSSETEAEIMSNVLTTLYHVPVKMVENTSHTTREEAQLLGPMLSRAGITHIYLITHAWHMPRSMFVFQKTLAPYHITVTAAPMGFVQLHSDATSDYLPLLASLNASVSALHEYVGMVWYRLFNQI